MLPQKFGESLRATSPSARRILIDLIVIFGAALLLRLITYDLDLFERFAEFVDVHENWELDELAVTVAIASLASFVFGIRRFQDQRRELALRLASEHHATMLAFQDPLTGLPNRRRFLESLATIANTDGARHAVIILDLDGFKQVNDVFGHGSGDQVLRAIARRLKSIGDDRILSARLGGDEFALIVRDLATPGEVKGIAEQIIAAVEEPIAAGGAAQHLATSVGIAFVEHDTSVAEEYMRRADLALYRAKDAHGSAYRIYDDTMDADLQESVQLEYDLRQALNGGQIVAKYQPIVDLTTGRIRKFEALARWHHPTRGEIPPAMFIPLAERRGLIADLTETILRQACREARSWPSTYSVAVNLSAVLLSDKAFNLRLVRILYDTKLTPSRLELEVSERALKVDGDVARPFLEGLRSLGVHISLDNFGTGHAGLKLIRQLPFDTIKIDRSFIEAMPGLPDRMQFVRAIVRLCNGLGMTVSAEGIEDADQLERLTAAGCAFGQGYFFSAPLDAPTVADVLQSVQKLRKRA